MATVLAVEGAREAARYLKEFDEDLLRAMNKEQYQVMKDLVKQARSLVPFTAPMSGWAKPSKGEWGSRLLYSPNKVRMGIRSKIGRVRYKATNEIQSAYLLVNANPAGMVYEQAGRRNRNGRPWNPKSTSKDFSHSSNPKAGAQFIENIVDHSGITVIGKQGRLAWKAVYDNRRKVAAQFEGIVNKYVAYVNKRLAA